MLRVSLKSGVQDGLALDQEIGGLAQMNHGGSHQAQAGVVMFEVVPAEERLTKTTSVFDGAEAIGEARAVFQGAELTFRIGIVVGNMGPGMCFGDTKVGHEQSYGFRFH